MPALLQSDSVSSILRDSLAGARMQASDSAVVADAATNVPATMSDTSGAISEALVRAKQSETAEAVSGVFEGILGGLHDATGFSKSVLINLFLSALVIALIWAVRLLIMRVADRRSPDVRTRYQWRKTSTYIAVVLGAFVFFRVWVGSISSFATFFGLVSAGIAIALKDPLANFAGWIFIFWRRPFASGDRITLRTHTGDVIDQRIFMFTLLEVATETGAGQSTGRVVHLPNGWVFTDSVINFTRGFPYVWNEIPVLVTFESNWRAAKQILFDVSAEHASQLSEDAERKLRRGAQEYLIFYSKLTPTVYTSVRSSGIELTMRYLVEPRRCRGSEQQIWEAILDAFALHDDIDFAYTTQRAFHHAIEGKSGTLPDARLGPNRVVPTPDLPPPINPDLI